jgi:tripartite-type tricarboxylate transporter receptor subunit TctC
MVKMKLLARLPGLLACATLAATLSNASHAAEWPEKPVRLIVPFPPGGGSDMSARVVGQKLSERLGQPVLVDNRPGAASNIAMDLVVRSPADGYTLLFAVPTVTQNPFLYKLSFDPLKDLVPVAKVAEVSFVLLSSPAFPARTLPEVLNRARQKPGTVTCGSAGATPGIGCQLLHILGKVDLNIVPYKGNAPAMTDLIGGQIDLLFDVVNAAQPQVASGRAHAVATTAPRRGTAPFPDIPTAAETLPGLELAAWQGVMAPAKTPAAVLQKLERELEAVMKDPSVVQKLRDAGIEPTYADAKKFGATIASDAARYGKVIRDTGMKAE